MSALALGTTHCWHCHEYPPHPQRKPKKCRMVARLYRLREEADVRRVRARGKACAHGPLVARILPNTLEPVQNRYTVIAGKKCGKAVDRNRLKRLTREALRGFHPHLKTGYDVAIIVRGDLTELPSLAVAQSTLERIFTKASLIDPTGETPPPSPGDAIVSGWYVPRTLPVVPEETEESS